MEAERRAANGVVRLPRSTYRLQLTRGWGFREARDLVPYLDALGISDLYSSPVLKARPGSKSGYDVVDPTRLNPELGGPGEFEALARELAQRNMGLLADFVPNHMAASLENPWWRDVLESGPASPRARFFDVRWNGKNGNRGSNGTKIVLPMLTDLFADCLEKRELSLSFERGAFCLRYRSLAFPVDPRTWGPLLRRGLQELEAGVGKDHPSAGELRAVVRDVEALPGPQNGAPDDLPAKKLAIRRRLEALDRSQPPVHFALEAVIASYRGEAGAPESFRSLEELIERQAYRLSFWKAGLERINYRRFFDISDLVGLRVEDREVFEASHSLLRDLYRDGKITGVRVDHIDGLRYPLEYLRRLAGWLAPEGEAGPVSPFVVVEKILTKTEELPEEWPVAGTTGYEFLGAVNRVFIDEEGERRLEDLYIAITASQAPFEEVTREKKLQVLEQLFASEMHGLSGRLKELANRDRRGRDLPAFELEQALREVTVSLPVYRTYLDSGAGHPSCRHLEQALEETTRRRPDLSPQALGFLRGVLLPDPALSEEDLRTRLDFVLSWQQFTGAVMAKGLEDTALYLHTPLISLNDVGAEPTTAATSPQEFQRWLIRRQARWPHTMNATSTHDTKRSEDVRARINVLSEIPHLWALSLRRWFRWNSAWKAEVNGSLVPGPRVELLLYQTLLGAWPPEGADSDFVQRVRNYMLKAVREGKTHTDWLAPRAGYEEALLAFIEAILDPSRSEKFLDDFLALQRLVAHYGALNSLGQVLLKIAAPGVPDLYQGNELWDFSLVDPDNRRPVDYTHRIALLGELARREEEVGRSALARDLAGNLGDGRIKLFITSRALQARREQGQLFSIGETIPLRIEGECALHVCAFGRKRGNRWAIVAVPRLATRLVRPGKLPLGRRAWGNSSLCLPPGAPGRWRHLFLGQEEVVEAEGERLPLRRVFRSFPVTLLLGSQKSEVRGQQSVFLTSDL